MKKQINRSELEAIGQNWLNRRNKLLAVADQRLNPHIKRLKALMLADVMNNRIARVAIALAKIRHKKDFAQGGFVPNSAHVDIGEYVIKTKKPTSY